MTSIETVHMVRLLLDDTKLSFVTLPHVLASIQEAQNLLLLQYYATGEERALRTFYANEVLASGSQIVGKFRYPRACLIVPASDTDDYLHSDYARWTSAEMFTNISDGAYTGQAKHILYTVYNGRVFYHGADTATTRASLFYVRTPNVFGETQALELPPEYHYEVAATAAELLNDLDVLEGEREYIESTSKIAETK